MPCLAVCVGWLMYGSRHWLSGLHLSALRNIGSKPLRIMQQPADEMRNSPRMVLAAAYSFALWRGVLQRVLVASLFVVIPQLMWAAAATASSGGTTTAVVADGQEATKQQQK